MDHYLQHSDGDDLDKLIKKFELENQNCVRLIQKENQHIEALEKEIREGRSIITDLQGKTSQLDDEIKQGHRQYTYNRDNCESLKKTLVVLKEHDEALDRQLTALEESSQKDRNGRSEILQHYKDVWENYQGKYKMFPLALSLEEKQNDVSSLEKRLQEMESQINHLHTQMNEINESNDDELKDLNKFIVSLAAVKLSTESMSCEIKQLAEARVQIQEQIRQEKEVKQEREAQMLAVVNAGEDINSSEASLIKTSLHDNVQQPHVNQGHSKLQANQGHLQPNGSLEPVQAQGSSEVAQPHLSPELVQPCTSPVQPCLSSDQAPPHPNPENIQPCMDTQESDGSSVLVSMFSEKQDHVDTERDMEINMKSALQPTICHPLMALPQSLSSSQSSSQPLPPQDHQRQAHPAPRQPQQGHNQPQWVQQVQQHQQVQVQQQQWQSQQQVNEQLQQGQQQQVQGQSLQVAPPTSSGVNHISAPNFDQMSVPRTASINQTPALKSSIYNQTFTPRAPSTSQMQAPKTPNLSRISVPVAPSPNQISVPRTPNLNQTSAPRDHIVSPMSAPRTLNLNQISAPRNTVVSPMSAPRTPNLNQISEPRPPAVSQMSAPRTANFNQISSPRVPKISQMPAPKTPYLNQMSAPKSPSINLLQASKTPNLNQIPAPRAPSISQILVPRSLNQISAPRVSSISQMPAPRTPTLDKITTPRAPSIDQMSAPTTQNFGQIPMSNRVPSLIQTSPPQKEPNNVSSLPGQAAVCSPQPNKSPRQTDTVEHCPKTPPASGMGHDAMDLSPFDFEKHQQNLKLLSKSPGPMSYSTRTMFSENQNEPQDSVGSFLNPFIGEASNLFGERNTGGFETGQAMSLFGNDKPNNLFGSEGTTSTGTGNHSASTGESLMSLFGGGDQTNLGGQEQETSFSFNFGTDKSGDSLMSLFGGGSDNQGNSTKESSFSMNFGGSDNTDSPRGFSLF